MASLAQSAFNEQPTATAEYFADSERIRRTTIVRAAAAAEDAADAEYRRYVKATRKAARDHARYQRKNTALAREHIRQLRPWWLRWLPVL